MMKLSKVLPLAGKIGRLLSVLPVLVVLSGCSQFAAPKSPGGGLGENGKINDFEKTEILPGSPAFANGSEQLLVAIHLKNSNSASVPNYRPEYEFIDGAGVIPSQCSTSDSNGISVCLVKATVPGKKVLRLINAKVGLESEIEFKAALELQRLAVLPASATNAATADGSRVQVSFGQSFQGVRHTTTDSYKVTFSLQGVSN